MFEMLSEKQIQVPEADVFKQSIGKHPKKNWEKLADSKNEAYATPQAIDLLSHLLVYNPDKRFSAKEAMEHSYFSGLS